MPDECPRCADGRTRAAYHRRQAVLVRLDRRDFLKLFGGGLLVCLVDLPILPQESGHTFGSHELPKDIAAWLYIAADGHVTVFTGKVEVGQNIAPRWHNRLQKNFEFR